MLLLYNILSKYNKKNCLYKKNTGSFVADQQVYIAKISQRNIPKNIIITKRARDLFYNIDQFLVSTPFLK